MFLKDSGAISLRRGFTLIEILVVMVIIGIAARWVIPMIPSLATAVLPEQQWMDALYAAQQDARKSESWIELAPGSPPNWTRWHWDTALGTWKHTGWLPPTTAELSPDVRFRTPFPQNHIWLAPQRVIPFVQAVCLSVRCVMIAPAGMLQWGASSDLTETPP